MRRQKLFMRLFAMAFILSLTTTAMAALNVSVSVNPDPVRPGETAHVEFTVTNTGTSAGSSLTLETVMPAEVDNFLSPTIITGEATCVFGRCDRGGTVTWNIGTLAAGEGKTFSFPPVVAETTTDGTPIVFTGTLKQSGVFQVDGSATAIVKADPVLELSLTEDLDPVAPGGLLTYTLNFGNRSLGVSSENAVLSMPIPTGTTFVSASNGGLQTGGSVEWSLGGIGAGKSGTHQLQVQVSAGASDGEVIKATAALTDSSIPVNEARASTLTRVQTVVPMSLSITANPDPVRPGETLNVAYTVTNLSSTPRFSVVLKTRMPDEVDGFLSPTLITGGATCAFGRCDRRGLVTWNIGTLAAGEGITVHLPAVASNNPDGTIIPFVAFVTDGTGKNVWAGRSVPVAENLVLELSLTEDLDPVAPGGLLTYTLTFGNRSSNILSQNAVLSMPIPTGTSFVSATGGGVQTGGTVEWSLGSIGAGESGTRQLQVQVGVGASDGEVIKAEAELTDISIPVNESRASAVTRVQAGVPMSLSISANPDPVRPGETLDIAYTVTNLSVTPRFSVVLKTRMPDEVDGFLSPTLITGGATCAFGRCDRRGLVTWNIGTLAAGEGITVHLPTVASNNPDGTIIPFAAFVTDGTGKKVWAGRSIPVAANPLLELSLTEDLDPAPSGGLLTYTLNFGNRSSGIVSKNAVLSMPIPTGSTFVSATGDGLQIGGNVEWRIGNIDAGESGTRQLQVQVNAGASGGEVIKAEAALTDSSIPVNESRASALTPVQTVAPISLSITANPNPVRPGETLNTTLSVTNKSASTLFSVVLKTRMPDEVDGFLSPTLITGGATCAFGRCDPRDLVTWNLGTLIAGQNVTVTMPPVVTSTIPEGTVIQFMALAFDGADNRADAATSVIVSNRPDITVDGLNKAFGSLIVGGTLDQVVTIRNVGNVDLTLGQLALANAVSPPFSIPSLSNNCSGATLLQGGSCTFTVRFLPTAVGPFNNSFDIPSNDPDESSVTVTVSGTGLPAPKPDITVTDSVAPMTDLQVPFGSITSGTPRNQTVTVSNDGDANLNIGAIASFDPLSAPFSILGNTCPGVLVPGANCLLTVQFSPTAAGTFDNTFDIPSDDPDENTVTVSVTGTAVAAPTPDITVTDAVVPVNDLQLPFGGLIAGITLDKTVTITNDGSENLVIDTIAFSNPVAAPFSIFNNNCSGVILPPSGSCNLTVRFSPITIGSFADEFDIPSNDPDEDPVIVKLTGNGLAAPKPEITVSDSVSPALDLEVPFGDVTEQTASPGKTITVTNDGSADLVIGIVALVDGSAFSILNNTCSGSVLQAGRICTLTVQFSPTATGLFNDTLNIPSDDSDENPVAVLLKGTGVAVQVPDITVTDTVVPPTDLQVLFGDVTVDGDPSEETITLTNDGNANLLIQAIASVDVISAPFSILNNTCSGNTIVALTGSCTLTVRFSPTAIGPFNDTFDIPSDDPDEGSLTITVKGTGIAAGIVNQNPTAPQLVAPDNGGTVSGTDVVFAWNRSTDSDGDVLTYTLKVCEDGNLTTGCITSVVVAAVKNKGMDFAGFTLGSGLLFGFVVVGSAKGRKKGGMLMAAFLVSGLLFTACGGGGGGGGGPVTPPTPPGDLSQTVTGLTPGKTYSWQVTADDGKGGTGKSETRSFTIAGQ